MSADVLAVHFLGQKRLFYPVKWSQDKLSIQLLFTVRVKTSPCSLTRACWSLRRQYCAKGGALRDAIPNRFLTDDFFIWEKSWRIECWALEYFSPWECQLLLQPLLVQIEEIQLLQGLFTVVTRAKYRASSSSSMSSADCIQKCQTREATCTWSLCCARGFICIKIYDVFITCAKEKKKKVLYILVSQCSSSSLLRILLHLCVWNFSFAGGICASYVACLYMEVATGSCFAKAASPKVRAAAQRKAFFFLWLMERGALPIKHGPITPRLAAEGNFIC